MASKYNSKADIWSLGLLALNHSANLF